MDKNDYNKRFTIWRINLKIRRLNPPPLPPPTVWNVPHVTFLKLRILKYFEVAPRILQSLWTLSYNFFFGAKLVFLMYSRNISMNCCYLAFCSRAVRRYYDLIWGFLFCPRLFLLHYQPWLFLCSSVHRSMLAMAVLVF